MTPQERKVMELALEALENLPSLNWIPEKDMQVQETITAIKEALAQPEQEPVAWKLLPREATREMLEAMDECSTEGYDERLYAGHAASVYMAAWDEAPTTPQRTWVGLTNDEKEILSYQAEGNTWTAVELAEAKLKEKNT